MSRLLRPVLLGPLAGPLHGLERRRFLPSAPPAEGSHVFLTGMPRAGVTGLLHDLHASGAFASLGLADLPYAVAPNLLMPRKGGAAASVDEVFWATFDAGAYIRPDHLAPHRPTPEVMARYVDWIRLILSARGGTRYLAAGSNTLLRLVPLARALPRSTILILFRDPFEQAQSLLEAHLAHRADGAAARAVALASGNLGYGAAHRPFRFGAAAKGEPVTPDYWLARWCDAYEAALPAESAHMNVAFVPVETLASDPVAWRKVAHRLELRPTPLTALRPTAPRAPGSFDRALSARAQALHRRLSERAALKLVL